MKILHLSDLHLGKRVNGFSMLDDQKYILNQILNITDEQQPQVVLIAGDVYDKSVPSAEAVEMLDQFLCDLAGRNLQVFMIGGNHDSAERLAFASRLIEYSGVHIARVYDGNVQPVSLNDEYGIVNFYMMPFVKPIHVKTCFPDATVDSYTDALTVAVQQMNVLEDERNVLVAHQFVTGTKGVEGVLRSESEDVSVGGLDNVDASAFASFDYVALGHIHSPQFIDGHNHIRYCGTPLKYSFSEVNHKKSVTMVEMGKKGELTISTLPLKPLHDLRKIRGSYEELVDRKNYIGTPVEDYLHVTLTNEQDVIDAIGKLRTIYPNIMQLEYDNARTRAIGNPITAASVEKQPSELFEDFFLQTNGREMSDEQKEFMNNMINKIWK